MNSLLPSPVTNFDHFAFLFPFHPSFVALTDLGSYHLPFLYSCVSFIGVLLLLLCTPLGFIRLFGVVGQVLVKPTTRDINEELHASYLEEASVLRKLENIQYNQTISGGSDKNAAINRYCDINSIPKAFNTIAHSVLRNRLAPSYFTATTAAVTAATAATAAATVTVTAQVHTNDLSETDSKATTIQRRNSNKKTSVGTGITAGAAAAATATTEYYNSMESDHLYERLRELTSERKELDKLRKSTGIQRNLVYPLAMLMLLFLTGITVLVVVQNMLELLIGIKALPLSTRVIHHKLTPFLKARVMRRSRRIFDEKDIAMRSTNSMTYFIFYLPFQQFTLGITSLSKVGPVGAAIEMLIIFYLCATSTVGLYTMPFMQSIRPQRHKTSLSQLIVNGALVLILSSALPLLSRILGMY